MGGYDAIVVGLGGMGSAALYNLAKRGKRVLGLERFDLANAFGSSHGATRIIRLAYFEGSQYVPLVRRAHALWHDLSREAGRPLIRITGSLDLAPIGEGTVESSRQSCLDHGLAHEMLDAREVMRRFPAFALPAGHHALLQPDGGFVMSEEAILAHAGLAQRHGAEVRTGEAVLSFGSTSGGVIVETERGRYSAGSLVLTAGPWMRELVPGALGCLATTKQTIGWFATSDPSRFRLGALPVFVLTSEEGVFYGFPEYGQPGMKLGGPHGARDPIDPNDPDRTPCPAHVEALRSCLARYLPGAAGEALMLRGCIYTVTPDEHFIIDRLPQSPNVIVASPCSGHGYKFATVIGEILADLATGGTPPHDISMFSLNRLQKSAAVGSTC